MSQQLRVLHIDEMKTWGGGQRQVLHLARGLKARGHEVTIACQPDGVLAHRALDAELSIFEINIRGDADIRAAVELNSHLRKHEYDIVHMHTAHAHTVGCVASAAAGRAKRVVSRRVAFPIKKHPLSLSKYKYRYLVHRYIAVSEAVKKVLVEGGVPVDMVSVVHSGVDYRSAPASQGVTVRRGFSVEDDAPVVGTIGALVENKGQGDLLQVVSQVLAYDPRTKFIVVGDGELRRELENVASRLGVNDSVLFPGFRTDIADLHACFDIYVLPSYLEGCNNALLDAMASGTPVVASDVGGNPEIVRHEENGLLVPAKDPNALAEAIIRLMSNKAEALRFAEAGKRTVTERFTVDKMVEGTSEVYRQLVP